jgi:hypothetical protein
MVSFAFIKTKYTRLCFKLNSQVGSGFQRCAAYKKNGLASAFKQNPTYFASNLLNIDPEIEF